MISLRNLQAWISDGGARADPVLLRQGSTALMEVAGENLITDQGLAAGTRFSFFGGGVTITRAEGRRTIGLRLSIAPDAPLGPRLLQVTAANGTAFLSGGLTVVPDPPVIQTISSRGLAVGDLNNDGQMDLVIANQEDRPSVLMNRGVPGGNWSLIKLRGTKSNRSAIGARVTLRAGGRSQMREIKSGGSYLSQSDLRVHFGLGADTDVDELKIRWPSGRVQVEPGIHANQITTIVEK